MAATVHNAATSELAEKTRLLLADLWRRNRPAIEERVTLLEQVAAAESISEERRAAALEVAHKLSGSLGMFGFEQGTVIAREMEVLLDAPHPNALQLAELTRQLRAVILPAS